MSAVNYWAVVPAAGIGSRMHVSNSASSKLPKQYLPLMGKTIIEQSLSRLLDIKAISKIVVSLNPEDEHWPHLAIASHQRIIATEGGSERSSSVLNGLAALAPFARNDDWVLVHDAARPCVTREAIEKLMHSLASHEVGGILAVPVSDTLKRSLGAEIETTLERSTLWQAHTPQLFRYGLLKQSLRRALDEGAGVTDEASALEFAGYKPKLIEDRRDNIKVTRPEDLAMAEAILAYQVKTKQET